MHHIIRIHAIISPIRERRTEWIYIKYFDISFTHGPGSICVVELNPLKKRKIVLLTNHYTVSLLLVISAENRILISCTRCSPMTSLKELLKTLFIYHLFGEFLWWLFMIFVVANLMLQSWRPPYVHNSGSWPIRLVNSRCTCMRQTFTEKYQIITTNFYWVLRLACRESWYLNLVLKLVLWSTTIMVPVGDGHFKTSSLQWITSHFIPDVSFQTCYKQAMLRYLTG